MDKQNINISHSSLRQKTTNNKIINNKDDKKISRNDPILMVIQQQISSKTSTHMFDLIMSDPLLQELNSSLQKEAEQQKKNKLLQTFPVRFKNLIQTQQLYKKLKTSLTQMQRQKQQVIQNKSLQYQQLVQQLTSIKAQLQQKNNHIQRIQRQYLNNKQQITDQYDHILFQKSKMILDLQRKLQSSKKQIQYFMQQLQQIKEESSILNHQNQKLILSLTRKQQQLNNLSLCLKQKQQTYKQSKQIFIKQLTLTKLKYQQSFGQKCKELAQKDNIIQGYKIMMIQNQNKIIDICNQKEEEDNNRFQEIQEVRMKLLEEIKQKNSIEERYEELQEKSITEIEGLNNQINHLQQEIANLHVRVHQNSLKHQLQTISLKETIRNKQSTHQQVVQSHKLQISSLSTQKLALQSKILKLQTQKQFLLQTNQKNKTDLQVYSKKIYESSSKQHKTQDKSKQIQKMIVLLKNQLSNYNQIINQKQQKIQEYRKQIMALKTAIKDHLSQKQKNRKQILHKDNIIKQMKSQNVMNLVNMSVLKQRQNVWRIQKDHLQKIMNRQKNSQETQFQIIANYNDEQQIKTRNLVKQLQKMKEKYDNLYQQLQTYKNQKQISSLQQSLQQLNLNLINPSQNPYQNIIKQLQQQNLCMKDLINTKLYKPQQIQSLLDSKIIDLKTFYQSKISQQGKKYRNVIQMLKGQMTQLYKEINQKKTMEDQIYNQIVQIKRNRQ